MGGTEVRFLQDDRHLYAAITVHGVDYNVRARIHNPRIKALRAGDRLVTATF